MIFFLYGADTYRSRQQLKQIKEKFKRDVDPSGLNLNVVDGSKASLDDLNKAISSLPFLAKRRMAVIEDIFTNKNSQPFVYLLEFLKKEKETEDQSIKVFWESLEEPTKGTEAKSFWQFLAKQKYAAEFQPLKGAPLTQWAAGQFQRNNVKASLAAVNRLIMLVGNDSWLLKNEIDKLSAYGRELGGHVTDEMADQLAASQFDDNIFDLVDAVGQQRKDAAVKLLSQQIANGKNELYLLAMLNRCFRILTLIKETPVDQHGKLGLHPFVVKKSVVQAAKFSSQGLKQIYQKLVELDEKIKTGYAKPAVLLDLFVVSI